MSVAPLDPADLTAPPGRILPGRILDVSVQPPDLERTIRRGTLVMAGAVGGLLLWAFAARLDSAAVTLGTVVVESSRKTVQHLEGGIVAEIPVREGEAVRAGQVLLRLDATRDRAALAELSAEWLAGTARLARLQAERRGDAGITFPDSLATQAESAAVERALEGQRALFQARRVAFEGELRVLQEQAQQAHRDIQAQRAVEAATTEQLRYTEQELAGVKELYDKGLERLPRLMSVRRYIAETRSRREGARAEIVRAEQSLVVARLQIEARQRGRDAEIAAEIEATELRLGEVTARLAAARDRLGRTAVVAPQDGSVVDLRVHTVGGVVQPGEPLMDIVPAAEALAVDVRIDPTDIDVVRAGMPARLRLTAYPRSRMPVLSGTVERVSADRLVDPVTLQPYYTARIRPDPRELDRLAGVQLVPGMAVEGLITTGTRQAIDYLLQPIRNSFGRALTEE